MSARLWLALAPLVVLGGCRAIAGYRDLQYEAPGDGGCAPVVLPSSGAGRIRLVNVGTKGTATSFCVRASGTSDWGTPVFGSSAPRCGAGLSYATATVPFAVASGSIDVEAIPVGQPCSAAATSSMTAIPVGDSTGGAAVVTVIRMGGATPERIVALPEAVGGTIAASVRLRLVNAIDGTQPIVIGLGSSPTLPATVQSPQLPAPIPPGGVEPATNDSALGPVDASGYVEGVLRSITLAAAFQGQTSALFTVTTPSYDDTQTSFAIGSATDPSFALRGLTCVDTAPRVDGGAASPSGILASCTLSDLPTLAIDTMGLALYGAFSSFEDDRRPAILQAIAARTSDLMCISDANRGTDKVAIAAAARGRFPYAFYPDPPVDLDGGASDPSTLDGGAPVSPVASPPCIGIPQADLEAICQCAAQKCTTTGDTNGFIATTNCLAEACFAPAAKLFHRGAQQNACFDCLLFHAVSQETIAHARDACTTDTRQPFTFDGQTAEMILSRYPLSEQQVNVLPGTGFRKSVLSAKVQLEDQAIDFYCADLVSSTIDPDLPYEGAYGQDVFTTLPDGGAITENGWQDDEDNQAAKAIAFIRANSARTGRPAIISGFWHASKRVTESAGNVLVDDVSPEILDSLERAFQRAEPPGYVPVCDQCPAPTNPYNGITVPLQTEMVFLLGFDEGSTTEDSLWGTESSVTLHAIPYEPAPDAGVGPISANFPRLVRVIRPRP